MSAHSAEPFAIDVPDEILRDLTERLARARYAQGSATPWSAGTDPAYLRELVEYWRGDFDWRAWEQELNTLPHFTATLDGPRVHYIHLRAAPSDTRSLVIPLVMTHGWPSSFVEMIPLARHLADPARFGGSEHDRFDVVIPSLPGFIFSDPLADRPFTAPTMAALWTRLMTEILGYPKFAAYGGDVGSHVTNFLGAEHPERIIGIYTHHPALHPVITATEPVTDRERDYLQARDREHDANDDGYAAMQSTRPDTLAAALVDSPTGLAAWIVEKYRTWSDCGGDLESRFSKDTLLTIITLYWVTGSIGHRIRRVLPILAATGEVSTDRKLSPPLAAADQTLSSLRPP